MADWVRTRTTREDFYRLPETTLRRELIAGEVIEAMTAPELDHQDVVGNLFVLLRAAGKAAGGKAYVAPVDVELDSENIVQPDVLLLAADSACQPLGVKRLMGAPDLVAEVLSPPTVYQDKRRKFHLYERFGVQEYWLAEPRDQTLEVWLLRSGRFERLDVYSISDTFESSLIGQVRVSEVFEA